MYLLPDKDAEVTDESHAPTTTAPHAAAPAEISLGARVIQDLIRVNIMLSVTNLMATLLLLAIGMTSFAWMFFYC